MSEMFFHNCIKAINTLWLYINEHDRGIIVILTVVGLIINSILVVYVSNVNISLDKINSREADINKLTIGNSTITPENNSLVFRCKNKDVPIIFVDEENRTAGYMCT